MTSATVYTTRQRPTAPSSWRVRLRAALRPAEAAPTFVLQQWLFVRLLGLVYLVAFASLAPQIVGLVGADGVLPVVPYLSSVRQAYGHDAYRLLPTLLWFWPGDACLRFLAWGGVALAVAVIGGVAQVPALMLLWLFYLSVSVAGQTFLGFQWDALLLETGLLGCFYAPVMLSHRVTADARPPTLVRWLLWWLLFRLMFLSGITKILSGDAAWANWTALTFHFETQPLPAWTSWYAHHLPPWLHRASVGGMYVAELAVPFGICVPSRFRTIRLATCGGLVLLQFAIAATGNYGFFNLLTLVLCISLLDDQALEAVLPGRLVAWVRAGARWSPGSIRRALTAGFGAVILCAGMLTFVREMLRTRPGGPAAPAWFDAVLGWTDPFRSVNGYGLFRVMTTERPEIVIEGSDDGVAWREYDFRWKPGEVQRRPRFVAPHQPRLDWQMWFAALNPPAAQRWLGGLLHGLLRGAEPVLALLGDTPFPNAPPHFVRLAYYDYRFSTPAEKQQTGAWWVRELEGYLTGALSLESFAR